MSWIPLASCKPVPRERCPNVHVGRNKCSNDACQLQEILCAIYGEEARGMMNIEGF